MSGLNGKVVLITGSSSGIGACAAVLFAKQGCALSLTGRNEERLNTVRDQCIKAGLSKDRVGTLQVAVTIGDITDDSLQAELLDNTLKLGPLNCLVNNAGVGGGEAGSNFCSINESMEVFDRIMNVNLRSVVSLTKLCLPHLEETHGTIVNISTVGAIRAFPLMMYYCVAKAGLDHFTRCLAAEMGGKGVRVNSINPGGVETKFADRFNMPDEMTKVLKEKMVKKHALGRLGTGDEVAKMILYLSSDDSSFTTGQTHIIDGGFTINNSME